MPITKPETLDHQQRCDHGACWDVDRLRRGAAWNDVDLNGED